MKILILSVITIIKSASVHFAALGYMKVSQLSDRVSGVLNEYHELSPEVERGGHCLEIITTDRQFYYEYC